MTNYEILTDPRWRILKPRVGHRVRVRVRLRVAIFFPFLFFVCFIMFWLPEKKHFWAPGKTVKEWFISVWGIYRNLILTHCVAKYRGMLKAVLSAKSVIFVARVSLRNWHSFEQTLWLFCRKQRYLRMDKERSYADVVSGSGKFIVLSSFFGDLEIFHDYTCDIWLTTCGYTPHQGLPTPMKDWWSGGWLCNLLYTGCSCPGWK